MPRSPLPHRGRVAVAVVLLLLLVVSLGGGPVGAQDAPIPPAHKVEPRGSALQPDLMNGQYVMTSGGSAGHDGACLYCHGAAGQGDGAAAVPRLAGQPLGYLRKQMHGYARESRPHPLMTPIAQALTDKEILDVSAWYAVQRAPFPPPPPVPPEWMALGERLALHGDPARDLQPCAACHGRAGEGIAPNFPYLAGQWASVTESQLLLWRRGERNNDPLNSMGRISQILTREEIRAVSLYYAALRGQAPDRPAAEAGG